MGCNL